MSISTESTSESYTGNGSTSVAYPVPFQYLSTDHVRVYAGSTDITGTCTFTGDGQELTGEFTTNPAIDAPTLVTVVLDIPLDQPTVLAETAKLPAKTIEEDGFDRLNMQIRKVWRWVQSSIRISSAESGASTGTADTLLGFDSSGDIEEVAKSDFMQGVNNLSEVDSAATARTNLGLGTAATSSTGDFAAASHTHVATDISDSTTDGRALLTSADAKEYTNAEKQKLASIFAGLNNLAGGAPPGVNDDENAGYSVGSAWIDTSANPDDTYRCVDASAGAAVWVLTSLEANDLAAVALSGSATDLTTGTLPIARITDGDVTYAKIQNVAADNVLLGNDNGAGQDVQELTAAEVRTMLSVESGADVTDAANVASSGAVMADGSGNDITGDIVFTEKADHTSTPSAGKGYLWVKDDAPSSLIFTDDAGNDTDLTNVAFALTSATEAIYVAKTGNDSNSGLTTEAAVLTITQAAVLADALVTGGADAVRIEVLDGGEYTGDIDLQPKIHVHAPSATIIGKITLRDECSAVVDQHYASTNTTQCLEVTGGGTSHYRANLIDTRGTGGAFTSNQAINNTGTGTTVYARVNDIIVGDSSQGLRDRTTGGCLNAAVGKILMAGNSAMGLRATDTGGNCINAFVNEIVEDAAGYTTTKGIRMNDADADVHITANEIGGDESYNVSAGQLWISCPNITNTRSGTPVVEISNHTLASQTTVDAATEISGNLPVANLGGGTGASVSTFWRGDGAWATPAGGGDVTADPTPSSNQVAVWTGPTSQKGGADLTYDGNKLSVLDRSITGPSGILTDNYLAILNDKPALGGGQFHASFLTLGVLSHGTDGGYMVNFASGDGNIYTAFAHDAGDYHIHRSARAGMVAGTNFTNVDADPRLFIEGSTGNVGIANDTPSEVLDVTGNIAVSGTVDGRDVATDGTKLDGITGTNTGNETAASVRALGFFDTTNDGTGSGLDADLLDGNEASAFALASHTHTAADVDTTGSANETILTADGANNAAFTTLASQTVIKDLQETGVSTGLVTGGVLSIGTGGAGVATTFSISDGHGYVLDTTTPSAPVYTKVSWTGKTDIAVTNITSQFITFVCINSAGTVVQSSSRWDPAEYRSCIILGVVVHVNKSTVDNCNQEQQVLTHGGSANLADLFEVLHFINFSGNILSGNPGSGLNLQKSSGVMFGRGINYSNSKTKPNHLTIAATGTGGGDLSQFQYRLSDGTYGTGGDAAYASLTNQSVHPTRYESAPGVLSTVAQNKFTAQRIFLFTSGNIKLQYGIAEYSTIDEAKAALSTENFSVESSIEQNGLFIGYLIVQESCTDLTNAADALFLQANKFGDAPAGGGSGGASDHGLLTGLADDDHTQYSLITSQPGAPSSTPGRVGEVNVDTTSDNIYISADTTGSGDWKQVNGGGGSVATDTIWDAAGDLAIGTGADTSARLAIGTNGQVLTSNGTTATWAAAAAADNLGNHTATQDLAMAGFNIDAADSIYMDEKAAADADIVGDGQLWVKDSAPNLLMFTDDDGNDGQVVSDFTTIYDYIFIPAGAAIPRTTNGAAAGTPTELATNDIMLENLAFDSATEEGVGFWITLPLGWDAGTIKIKPYWTAASGTGTVKWDFAARAYADDDAIDQALGTEQGVTDTWLAANDMHIGPTTSALTIGGTPADGEPFYLQVARDIATDTLGVDALLIGFSIEYSRTVQTATAL